MASYAEMLVKSIGIFKQTNPDILSVLGLESEVLANIQRDFSSLRQARVQEGKPPIEITCFYEELPVRGLGQVFRPSQMLMISADATPSRLSPTSRLRWMTGLLSGSTATTAT